MPRSNHFALALLVGLGAVHCARGGQPEPPGALKEGTPPAARCDAEAHATRARAVLAAASNACRTVEDCECYAGTLFANCGGVTDRATADRINALTGEAANANCESTVQCAARRCEPVCEQGRCR